jgi:hypothetical protein
MAFSRLCNYAFQMHDCKQRISTLRVLQRPTRCWTASILSIGGVYLIPALSSGFCLTFVSIETTHPNDALHPPFWERTVRDGQQTTFMVSVGPGVHRKYRIPAPALAADHHLRKKSALSDFRTSGRSYLLDHQRPLAAPFFAGTLAPYSVPGDSDH